MGPLVNHRPFPFPIIKGLRKRQEVVTGLALGYSSLFLQRLGREPSLDLFLQTVGSPDKDREVVVEPTVREINHAVASVKVVTILRPGESTIEKNLMPGRESIYTLSRFKERKVQV